METRGLAILTLPQRAPREFVRARPKVLEHLKRWPFDREIQDNVNDLARRLRRKWARSRGLCQQVLGHPRFRLRQQEALRLDLGCMVCTGMVGREEVGGHGNLWWALRVMEIPRLWLVKATSLPCPSFDKVQIQYRGGPQSLLAHLGQETKGRESLCPFEGIGGHSSWLAVGNRSGVSAWKDTCRVSKWKGRLLERLGPQVEKKEKKRRLVQQRGIARSAFLHERL